MTLYVQCNHYMFQVVTVMIILVEKHCNVDVVGIYLDFTNIT